MTGRIVREAFAASLPVLTGYGTMGFASGALLALNGGVDLPGMWAAATSAAFVSGPLQFLLVDWVRNGTGFADVAAIVICMNMRYSLYGISLLERFRAAPAAVRLYLIGTVTDETYALQTQCRYPAGRSGTLYCFLLAMFDHMYWVIGVTAGALAGSAVKFEAKGIDFAMTALFLVILTDQCREAKNRGPALLGAGCALAAAAVMRLGFGSWDMLLPAMGLTLAGLLACRRVFERGEGGGGR